MGDRMVVNGMVSSAANGVSLYPTTATSSGTSKPRSRSTPIAAMAATSFGAKMESGRIPRSKISSIAVRPPAAAKGPSTRWLSGISMPASRKTERKPFDRSRNVEAKSCPPHDARLRPPQTQQVLSSQLSPEDIVRGRREILRPRMTVHQHKRHPATFQFIQVGFLEVGIADDQAIYPTVNQGLGALAVQIRQIKRVRNRGIVAALAGGFLNSFKDGGQDKVLQSRHYNADKFGAV